MRTLKLDQEINKTIDQIAELDLLQYNSSSPINRSKIKQHNFLKFKLNKLRELEASNQKFTTTTNQQLKKMFLGK